MVWPTIIQWKEHFMGMYPLEKLLFKKPDDTGDQCNVEEYLTTHLIRIIWECGIHEHSATSKKNGHAGDNKDCHMLYPQPIFNEISVFLDHHINREAKKVIINGVNVIFPRDHWFVVAMNKWITLVLASNTIVYYLSSDVEGRTRALYATKYMMKQPLSTYEAIALFKVSLEAKQKHLEATANIGDMANYNVTLSTSMIVTWCLNALTSEIVIIWYKCSTEIVDFHDHYASKKIPALKMGLYVHDAQGRVPSDVLGCVERQHREDGRQGNVGVKHARLRLPRHPR